MNSCFWCVMVRDPSYCDAYARKTTSTTRNVVDRAPARTSTDPRQAITDAAAWAALEAECRRRGIIVAGMAVSKDRQKAQLREAQRRRRARRKADIAVLQVAVPFVQVTEALIERGLLKAWDAESRTAAADALAAFVLGALGVMHDADGSGERGTDHSEPEETNVR